jgi:hypothetical protein
MSTTISGIDQPGANRSGATSNIPDTHRQEIHAWVRKFGIRQALVLLVQGLSVAILCMIACASIIVLLDTLRMIDDPTRYALSLGMYALSIGVGLWYGIARWWRKEDPIQLAKHVEHASPELNESLLSALELDRTPIEKRHFSPEFLAAIQRNVAQQLQGLSIPKMLPWSLVRRVVLSALGFMRFARYGDANPLCASIFAVHGHSKAVKVQNPSPESSPKPIDCSREPKRFVRDPGPRSPYARCLFRNAARIQRTLRNSRAITDEPRSTRTANVCYSGGSEQ